MCFLYPDDVMKTTVYQKKKFRTKRHKALEFKYYELINIADELSWFPPKRITWGKRATLAGFVHELRKLRNYVHPGVWAPEHPDTLKFTKAVYAVVYEIFDVETLGFFIACTRVSDKLAESKGRCRHSLLELKPHATAFRRQLCVQEFQIVRVGAKGMEVHVGWEFPGCQHILLQAFHTIDDQFNQERSRKLDEHERRIIRRVQGLPVRPLSAEESRLIKFNPSNRVSRCS
jgi:hypothetical protein